MGDLSLAGASRYFMSDTFVYLIMLAIYDMALTYSTNS
jgi:hypothetical protein